MDVSFAQIEDLPSGIASGLSYYKILVYKQNEDNAFIQVGTGTTVSYDSSASTYDCTVGNLDDESVYKVVVVAYDLNGNYSTAANYSSLITVGDYSPMVFASSDWEETNTVSIDLDDFTGRLMKRNGRSGFMTSPILPKTVLILKMARLMRIKTGLIRCTFPKTEMNP